MQAIVDTIVNFYNALVAYLTEAFTAIKGFFNAILQTIQNVYYAVIAFFTDSFQSFKSYLVAIQKNIENAYTATIAFFTDAFASIKSFFVSITETFSRYYQAVVDFFKTAFNSIKSFFNAFFETLSNGYDSIIIFCTNAIISFVDWLADLPVWLFAQMLDLVNYIFDWMAGTEAGQASADLAAAYADVWADIAAYGSTLLYCLGRAGVGEAVSIIASACTIWSVAKTVRFIVNIL